MGVHSRGVEECARLSGEFERVLDGERERDLDEDLEDSVRGVAHRLRGGECATRRRVVRVCREEGESKADKGSAVCFPLPRGVVRALPRDSVLRLGMGVVVGCGRRCGEACERVTGIRA